MTIAPRDPFSDLVDEHRKITPDWYSWLTELTKDVTDLQGKPSSSSGVDWINVKTAPFNAVGDGIADDTAAIQAAIDYAYSQRIRTIYLPSGNYKTSGPLYLDPPANLRVSLTGAPSTQAFSLALIGDEGGANHEGFGTNIKPTTNDFVVLWVGPGQNNYVAYLNILFQPNAASHKAYPPSGCGIAVAAYASRCVITNCEVLNFSTAISIGHNQDTLADSNTIHKCFIAGCYVGIKINQTQNYINTISECTVTDYKYALHNALGRQVNVFGGNWSSFGAFGTFTISAVSALSGAGPNYTFTATIASPDVYWANGDYDSFVIKTVEFGLVPLELVSYDTGTHVATFKFLAEWVDANYGPNSHIAVDTDIQAKLQAEVTIYACERLFVIYGSAIHLHGLHVENFQGITTLVDCTASFGGEHLTRIEDVFCNWNLAVPGGGTPALYCQQAFPFIRNNLSDGTILISSLTTRQERLSDALMIDLGRTSRLRVQNADLYCPNIRVSGGGSSSSDVDVWQSCVDGGGEWDVNPFLSRPPSGQNTANHWRSSGAGGAPMMGYHPATYATPRLRPDQITTMSGALPALGSYPLAYGSSIYSVAADASSMNTVNTGTPTLARFAHRFYSYGQDLTNTWTYLGQSSVVRLANMDHVFPGLMISLDNGGGPTQYVVCRTYPSLGYVEVAMCLDFNGRALQGTKTVSYTGATVVQEPYSIQQLAWP